MSAYSSLGKEAHTFVNFSMEAVRNFSHTFSDMLLFLVEKKQRQKVLIHTNEATAASILSLYLINFFIF